LRNESRVVGDPVAHDDAAARLCDSDHLLGDVEGLGSEHRAENGERQIERMIGDAFEVAGVSLLKLEPVEPCLFLQR
jgi:hypothetical protein